MNSITYGNISKVLSEITTDISNNIGKHNTFVVITNSENHYPEREDPVILRFDQNIGEWILVADKTVLEFGYLKETIDIYDDDAFLEKQPLDNIVWDVYILNTNGDIIKTLNSKELLVTGNLLTGLKEYIGNTLSLMYAFGNVNETTNSTKVDRPIETTYYNQTIDVMTYDGPYDMNDILTDIDYPEGNSYFDKIILDRIRELDRAVELMNSRKLYTIEKTLIENNKIKLPYKAIGSVVHDMALIYLTNDIDDKTIIVEVTCSVLNNEIIFDESDVLDGYYAVVSYLAELGTPIL